jgi:hypothetical protein
MTTVATGLADCLNCGAPLSGAYCGACGQKATSPHPTFHDLVHEFTHEMLHVDGRLFQSIRLLFTRPGQLTRDHTGGRRARHIAPLRLYLIFSVVYFAAAAYVPHATTVRQDPKRGRVVTTGGVNISGDVLLGRLTEGEIEDRVHRAQHDWLPKLMFVLVPVWALLVMAVTRRERRHFPEHLYFSLHAHAAFFGVFAVGEIFRVIHQPTLGFAWGLLSVAYVCWYSLVVLHQVYGGSWLRATMRTTGVLAVYAVVLIAAFIGFFVAALLV